MKGPKAQNVKQAWVDAVTFAQSECIRVQQLLAEAVRTKRFSELPKNDLMYELRGPDGTQYIYGREAGRRLFEAASDALARSDIARTVSIDHVFKLIKATVAERFFKNGKPVTLGTVDSAFAAAIKEARKLRADSRHFIPCQLMFVADPDHFSIGPVTFHNRITFKPIAEQLASEHRREAAESGTDSYVDRVLEYYGRFSWVADVTVKDCDKEISEERALQAVSAALDFLHLLFGHYHTRKMVVAGPGLEADIWAKMQVREGKTLATYSVGASSAVGFEEGWANMLTSPDEERLLVAAGSAIEPLVDPALERPLGQRFIDAASWHGQAVREASPAAAVVKSVSALERLVTTEESTNVSKAVCERSAAMCYGPASDERFETILGRMESIYDLRSRLVHGNVSPFDPEVRRRRFEALAAVEQSLINGLALFDQEGLLDSAPTRRQLKIGFQRLVTLARAIDARIHSEPITS